MKESAGNAKIMDSSLGDRMNEFASPQLGGKTFWVLHIANSLQRCSCVEQHFKKKKHAGFWLATNKG